MDMSEKIYQLRTENVHLSQESFAKRLGVHRNTVKNWETGISAPTVSHIVLISLLCDITTDYLIFDDCQYDLSLNGLNDEDYAILNELISYLSKKDDD